MQKLNRREFLNSSVKFFVFIGAGGAIVPSLTGCSSEPKGVVNGNLSFVSLSQVLNELEIFKKLNSIRGYGAWDAGKVFLHCAQSIEYSI